MPEIQRKRRPEPRESDPLEESSGETGKKVLVGCTLAFVGMLLGIGALGLVVGGWQRFGRPAVEVAMEDEADPDVAPLPGTGGNVGGSSGGPRTPTDPLEDMRRRYLPGPHVTLEGLIPSARALGGASPTSGGWTRSADTPWVVLGAAYERESPPAASMGGPTCAHAPGEAIDRPLDVVAGAPVLAQVRAADASGGTGVESYLVAFDGYPGHFVLPARVMTELGSVAAAGSDGASIRFTIGTATRPDRTPIPPGMPFRVTMRMAAVDASGGVSAWITRPLDVISVGTGDVEVTLTMSVPTDLDLYVSDPSGSTVYYGNTTGPSGGHLDLDANAACSGNMGIDTEHVFWPAGRAPAGTYVVRVAHYESCVRGARVDYRLTVVACGETAVLTGSFTGMGRGSQCLGRSDDPSWCQDVVTFSIPACAR